MSSADRHDECLTRCPAVVRCYVAEVSCRCSDCSDPSVDVVSEWIEERVQKIPFLLQTKISPPKDDQCQCDREHDQVDRPVDHCSESKFSEGNGETGQLTRSFPEREHRPIDRRSLSSKSFASTSSGFEAHVLLLCVPCFRLSKRVSFNVSTDHSHRFSKDIGSFGFGCIVDQLIWLLVASDNISSAEVIFFL